MTFCKVQPPPAPEIPEWTNESSLGRQHFQENK
jgi:hypothetical protein